VLLLTL
jgi:hypothetical protein